MACNLSKFPLDQIVVGLEVKSVVTGNYGKVTKIIETTRPRHGPVIEITWQHGGKSFQHHTAANDPEPYVNVLVLEQPM